MAMSRHHLVIPNQFSNDAKVYAGVFDEDGGAWRREALPESFKARA